MVSPKWQIAGYHENTMIRGWLIVHPRGRGGDDGLLKNPRFPPFFRRCWMLLDGEKRTNGARGRRLRPGLIGVFGIVVVFHEVAPVGGAMPGDGTEPPTSGLMMK